MSELSEVMSKVTHFRYTVCLVHVHDVEQDIWTPLCMGTEEYCSGYAAALRASGDRREMHLTKRTYESAEMPVRRP